MSVNYLPHRFNPEVAEVYGVEAALLYQYINHRSRFQKQHGGNRWIEFTLDGLCKQYPYLGRYQIWSALQRLINAGKKTPPIVFRKMRGGVYIYTPAVDDSQDALQVFDVNMACRLGVVPSIIFSNVRYWIKQNWSKVAGEAYELLKPDDFDFDDIAMQRFAFTHTQNAAGHFASIADWVAKNHRYISHRTAKRGFQALQHEGLLQWRRIQKGKPFWFPTKKLLQTILAEVLNYSDLENVGANSKRLGAKTKCDGAKTKQVGAKTKQESRLDVSEPATSDAVVEAVVEEGVDCGSYVQEDLPTASLRGGTSSAGSRVAPEVISRLRKLNQAQFPELKRRMMRDSFGNPVKRKYARVPSPDDPEFDEWYDCLSPAARREYHASRS